MGQNGENNMVGDSVGCVEVDVQNFQRVISKSAAQRAQPHVTQRAANATRFFGDNCVA